MTPFNTALNVAGGMQQSTPKAILPKPLLAVKQAMVAPPIKKRQSSPNAQVAAYGKAMNQAIKNTKSY